MTNRREEIEELEYLEQEFIIGMKPLTDEQKELLENIAAMELQRDIYLSRVKRYERVIDALRSRLVNSYSKAHEKKEILKK